VEGVESRLGLPPPTLAVADMDPLMEMLAVTQWVAAEERLAVELGEVDKVCMGEPGVGMDVPCKDDDGLGLLLVHTAAAPIHDLAYATRKSPMKLITAL
jgi:hypothetical protein